MQTFMSVCMILNCALTTVIMLVARSKWDKGGTTCTFRSQVICV